MQEQFGMEDAENVKDRFGFIEFDNALSGVSRAITKYALFTLPCTFYNTLERTSSAPAQNYLTIVWCQK